MNSLAIWYQGKQDKNIDVHINFWKLPSKPKAGRFLDIGLNVPDSLEVEKIYIFIPFSIEEKDINDLGKTIVASSAKLLTAIFNEDYRITSSAKSDYHRVNDQYGKEVFNIYTMSETNFSLSTKYSGTVITITMPQKQIREKKTYIRFRITGENLTHFSRIEKDVSSILNSAFVKNEILDFRVNSARHLPNKLLEEMSQYSIFNITKIHFFYICATQNIKDISTEETFIAYHWKDKEKNDKKIEDFNVFLKTNFRDKDLRTIIKYIVFLLMFTIASGLITNFIYSKLSVNTLPDKPTTPHKITRENTTGSKPSFAEQLSVVSKKKD